MAGELERVPKLAARVAYITIRGVMRYTHAMHVIQYIYLRVGVDALLMCRLNDRNICISSHDRRMINI